ncbi:MAG: hypothetical protein AB1815_13480 [Bacillota bacterium]
MTTEQTLDGSRYGTLTRQYGDLWDYRTREEHKILGWNEMRNDSLTLEERLDGAIKILWSWFSRSVLAAMSDEHPDLPEYAAMLLSQEHSKETFPEPVRAALIGWYGQRPGIPEGKSYWRP